MGGGYAGHELPGRVAPSDRTVEQVQEDVVHAMLTVWQNECGLDTLEEGRVHGAFPFFLAVCCAMGEKVSAWQFYRDYTSRRYLALEAAISELVVTGYIHRSRASIGLGMRNTPFESTLKENHEFPSVQTAAVIAATAYRRKAQWEQVAPVYTRISESAIHRE